MQIGGVNRVDTKRKEEIKKLADKWGEIEIYPERREEWKEFCKNNNYNAYLFQVIELMRSGDPYSVYQKQSQNRLGEAYGKIPDYAGIEKWKKAMWFSRKGTHLSDLIANLEPIYYEKEIDPRTGKKCSDEIDDFQNKVCKDQDYFEARNTMRLLDNSSFRDKLSPSGQKQFDYYFKLAWADISKEAPNESWNKSLVDAVVNSAKIISSATKGKAIKVDDYTLKIVSLSDPTIARGWINDGSITPKQQYEALKTNITTSSNLKDNYVP